MSIVIDDSAILVDLGGRATQILENARRSGWPALAPARVRHLFVTHLHSDHTAGIDDLLMGGWVLGRTEPLEIWGPPGTEALVEHLRAAHARDIEVRTRGLEGLRPEGSRAIVHEIAEPGEVFRSSNTSVRAFPVAHGSWPHAFGYRVEGPDRVVVVSGDTAPTDAVVEACDGCDVLVHEVYSTAGWRRGDASFRAYHAAFHTSGEELGRLAARARPDLLVLTHVLFFGEDGDSIVEEVRGGFDGRIELAEDLASY